jgi:hypothetical protein
LLNICSSIIRKSNGSIRIFRQTQCIYIGKGDIRRRLLDHLNDDNPCILKENPANIVDEVTIDMDNREKELIKEYDPS